MGIRFTKRMKVAPGVRLNVGLGGVSVTAGRRGASVNVGKRGVRGTAGVPGSGLSYSEKLPGGKGFRVVAAAGIAAAAALLGWLLLR